MTTTDIDSAITATPHLHTTRWLVACEMEQYFRARRETAEREARGCQKAETWWAQRAKDVICHALEDAIDV